MTLFVEIGLEDSRLLITRDSQAETCVLVYLCRFIFGFLRDGRNHGSATRATGNVLVYLCLLILGFMLAGRNHGQAGQAGRATFDVPCSSFCPLLESFLGNIRACEIVVLLLVLPGLGRFPFGEEPFRFSVLTQLFVDTCQQGEQLDVVRVELVGCIRSLRAFS